MIITIRNMKYYAFHGVLPQERIVGGWYEVEVALETDNIRATETDDVSDTINYAEVYELVRKEMLKPSNLIEHVAGRIGKCVLQVFPTCKCTTVKVIKKNPPISAAGVEACVELNLKR